MIENTPALPPPSISSRLMELGCGDPKLAEAVEDIVTHVSYTLEKNDPDAVNTAVVRHPELRMVQDADGIDAVGIIGIGRLYTYGGAKERTLDQSFECLKKV
jgi:uncharacterized protein